MDEQTKGMTMLTGRETTRDRSSLSAYSHYRLIFSLQRRKFARLVAILEVPDKNLREGRVVGDRSRANCVYIASHNNQPNKTLHISLYQRQEVLFVTDNLFSGAIFDQTPVNTVHFKFNNIHPYLI